MRLVSEPDSATRLADHVLTTPAHNEERLIDYDAAN
jgi:hypothetical protein